LQLFIAPFRHITPHSGMTGQPLETGLCAAGQVLAVHEEILEQLEPRGGVGGRRGDTAGASRRKRAERVPGQWLPWRPLKGALRVLAPPKEPPYLT